jgi:hypothetical protein
MFNQPRNAVRPVFGKELKMKHTTFVNTVLIVIFTTSTLFIAQAASQDEEFSFG